MGEDVDRRLANALPQIVWTVTADGTQEWINDRWTELTGIAGHESSNATSMAAIHPDDRLNVQARWDEAVATGKPAEFEYRIRTRDGTYRWHLARIAPMHDERGVLTRWVGAAFDMHDRRAAEEALRASERRFEQAFKFNPQPMAIAREKDAAFVQVNDAFLEMTGFTQEEVLEQSVVTLGMLTPEQRNAIGPWLRSAARRQVEMPFRIKSGKTITVVLTTTRIDLAGEPCLLGVADDVTEQRATEAALRHSEARARARADELSVLMDAVPAAVWITHDPECKDLRSNRAGNELLRLSPNANISPTGNPDATKHMRVLSNGVELAPDDLPVQRAARGIEVRDFEKEIRFDDNRSTFLYGSAVPLRDPSGSPRGAIGAFVDVTHLKHAQAVMREADRRKDEFLALLSHELRNPLAPIITAAQLMELRGDAVAVHEREVILRQARHLVRLVDDLLDVSRVTRGKVALAARPIDLSWVIQMAVEATEPLFEQHQHCLTLDVAPGGLPVIGDEVRLNQVMSNLLSNAARYTPAGGHVEVTAKREGTDVVVRVRDNGIGIDRVLLPNVFELFVQGERGPDRALGGLGLGLSLARMFTELHGGTVDVASAGIGKGSEFTVRLPLSASIDTAKTTRVIATVPPPPRSRLLPKRILVVDDNQDAGLMISRVLEGLGHTVRIANDPAEALAVALTFKPEVAIIDIGLPVMDGYELGRELRARLASPPRLLALTGYGLAQDRRRSHEAGFVSHLVKPLDVAVLLAALEDLAATET